MHWWAELRHRVLVEGISKCQALRETGIHWTTLEKILRHSEPPGYRGPAERDKPKLGPYLGRIREILEADKACPVRQRHTAKRIFERLQEEGHGGEYTQVRAAVRQLRQAFEQACTETFWQAHRRAFEFLGGCRGASPMTTTGCWWPGSSGPTAGG